MKCLTVQQPWAWAIINGGKDIENRTNIWHYRGPLAIHAGKRWSDRGGRSGLIWTALEEYYGWPTGPVTARDDARPGFNAIRPLGAIIGIVELVDVHMEEGGCCAPWGEKSYASYIAGQYKIRHDVSHLVLERPRRFVDPIPARGRLSLWTPEPELEQLIDLALLDSKPGVWDDGYRHGDHEDMARDRDKRIRTVDVVTDREGRL